MRVKRSSEVRKPVEVLAESEPSLTKPAAPPDAFASRAAAAAGVEFKELLERPYIDGFFLPV